MAWKKEFAPVAPMILGKRIPQCCMTSTTNEPDLWFSEITYMQSWIDSVPNVVAMTDDDIIAHMLANLLLRQSRFLVKFEV
jgi:hypothetical protein